MSMSISIFVSWGRGPIGKGHDQLLAIKPASILKMFHCRLFYYIMSMMSGNASNIKSCSLMRLAYHANITFQMSDCKCYSSDTN